MSPSHEGVFHLHVDALALRNQMRAGLGCIELLDMLLVEIRAVPASNGISPWKELGDDKMAIQLWVSSLLGRGWLPFTASWCSD